MATDIEVYHGTKQTIMADEEQGIFIRSFVSKQVIWSLRGIWFNTNNSIDFKKIEFRGMGG